MNRRRFAESRYWFLAGVPAGIVCGILNGAWGALVMHHPFWLEFLAGLLGITIAFSIVGAIVAWSE